MINVIVIGQHAYQEKSCLTHATDRVEGALIQLNGTLFALVVREISRVYFVDSHPANLLQTLARTEVRTKCQAF